MPHRAPLERTFEGFYRVDRARSRGTGGTGLGLSIVRHIATNDGGEISVDSTEGRGSGPTRDSYRMVNRRATNRATAVRTNTRTMRVNAAPQARSMAPSKGWRALMKICADSEVFVPLKR